MWSENNFFGTDATGAHTLLNDVAVRLCGNGNAIKANVINAQVTAVQIIGILNIYFGQAIPLDEAAGTGNVITGNWMGTNAEGDQPFSVPGIGVHLAYGPLDGVKPQNNLIGAKISFRDLARGIQLGAVNTPVLNNRIRNMRLRQTPFTESLPQTPCLTSLSNVISHNGLYGIYLTDEVSDNIIQGNFIGTDRTGMQAHPNGRDGIRIATPYFFNWWRLPVQQNRSTPHCGQYHFRK